MSSDFEWRFGGELPEDRADDDRQQRWSWQRLLAWGLLLLLVGGAAYAWWRQRQGALDQAEAQVEQIASLELHALVEGDAELFLTLQDSADSAWREAQGTYTQMSALSLPIQGLTVAEIAVESARVVGDRAEVQLVYTTMLPDGRSASFHAIRFYRYTDNGRWLHTRADAGAGGRTFIFRGTFTELSALERDADWLEPLVSELQGVTSRFCDLVACRQDLPVALDLAAGLDEGAAPDDMTLPAPYFVGAPQDEAALEAWRAALKVLVLEHLVARETDRGANDLGGELFEDRLDVWFRAQLGVDRGVYLRDEPPDAVLKEAAPEGLWVPLRELYWMPPDDPRRPLAEAQIDLLLSFLEDEYGASSVAALVHAFDGAESMRDLLVGTISQPWFDFQSRYLAYLREATAERVDDLGAFTSYDLLVSCWGPTGSFLELWGLRLDQSRMTLLSAGSGSGPLRPVGWSPDGTALLLRRQTLDEGYLLLRQESAAPRPFLKLPQNAEYVSSVGPGDQPPWSADGRYLAYRTLGPSLKDGIVNLDTDERTTLDGRFVAWAPIGTRLVTAEPAAWHWTPESDVATFWLQDVVSGSRWSLGQGYDAAWSPEGSRIALISSEPAVKVIHVETGESTTLLDRGALRRTLGFTPTLSAAVGRPFRVAWSPQGERVAVGATRSGGDVPEESLTILLEERGHRILHQRTGGIYDIVWSPDGRWLTTFTFEQERFRSVVSDITGDILFEEEDAFVSWSPSGRHVAVFRPPLRVLEIEARQWRAFDTPEGCFPMIWNPRAPNDEPIGDGAGLFPWTEWRTTVQTCDLPHCQP